VDHITFQVRLCEESGWLVASWAAPGAGGITTQAKDLRELQERVLDSAQCHFEPGEVPRLIRFHFITDAVVILS